MFELSDNVKSSINRKVLNAYGMTLEEFEELDFDEQQIIVSHYRKKMNTKKQYLTMIGNGENAIFLHRQEGDRVMLFDGTMVRVGNTPEDARESLNKRIDEIMTDDESFVKKIKIKIKRI